MIHRRLILLVLFLIGVELVMSVPAIHTQKVSAVRTQTTPAIHMQTANLIRNPFLQMPDSTGEMPQGWQKNAWGTNNTTFSYLNNGQNGTKSVYVKMTSHISGDAKWYFNAVTVSPNTQLTFSDDYKSSVSTSLVAWIIDTAGNSDYVTLGTVPASTDWKHAQLTFTTPSYTRTVTIFHLLNSVGYLQTDKYVLRLASAITNNVLNNSLEQPSASDLTHPLDWTIDHWGTNTVHFDYLNTGHTGSHSVETEITSYTDGDAKWYYTPQPAQAGVGYTFTDYYMANIPSQVVVMINKADGSTQYLKLRNAEPANTWTQYSDTFITPANTQTLTMLHLIQRVGHLITDDYSVASYTPVGFNRAMVSLTFDDGWQSQYTNGLPILNKHHAKGTFYLVPGFFNTSNYLTVSQAEAIQQVGNQISSHTMHHRDLVTLNPTQLTNELLQSQQILQSNFGAVQDFASPYGSYNSQVVAAIKKYYRSHRSTDTGYNSKDNFDIYNIRTQTVLSTTTIDEMNSWVDQAQREKTWLIIVFHEINTNGSLYSITPQKFDNVLTCINKQNMPLFTVGQAISEIVPQLQSA